VFTDESIESIVRTVMTAPEGTVTVRGSGGGGAAGVVAIAGCAVGRDVAGSVEVTAPSPAATPAAYGAADGLGFGVLREAVFPEPAGSAGFASLTGAAVEPAGAADGAVTASTVI